MKLTSVRLLDCRMKIAAGILTGLCLSCGSWAVHAQVPAVLGTWKFNIKASKFPGPAPQMEIRSYRLTDGGVLIGVAVNIDAQGRPNFLQFAAKPDGKDYPEFDTASAAKYLADGTAKAAQAPALWILPQVSRNPTVRLNTSRPGAESSSRRK